METWLAESQTPQMVTELLVDVTPEVSSTCSRFIVAPRAVPAVAADQSVPDLVMYQPLKVYCWLLAVSLSPAVGLAGAPLATTLELP